MSLDAHDSSSACWISSSCFVAGALIYPYVLMGGVGPAMEKTCGLHDLLKA
jgi:hypothetical protein